MSVESRSIQMANPYPQTMPDEEDDIIVHVALEGDSPKPPAVQRTAHDGDNTTIVVEDEMVDDDISDPSSPSLWRSPFFVISAMSTASTLVSTAAFCVWLSVR